MTTVFWKNIPLTLFDERVVCERELETEQNCNILTPTLMAISVVSFSFSRVVQPEAWGPSSLLYTGFFYHILSPNWLNVLYTQLYKSSPPTQSPPITGHRNMHFRRLWNGIFDRHRAEITVMQFTGHSLPVHQFVTVPWDFNPVPYCQPSLPTPMVYALPPSLEWHVWRGWRSIYNNIPVIFVMLLWVHLILVFLFGVSVSLDILMLVSRDATKYLQAPKYQYHLQQ